jgi:acetyl-CoA synthetase
MESLNWNSVKCFSSTGEVSNPEEMTYLMQLAGNKPVIEYCGGTEIGGGYVTGTVIQPNYASLFSTQALGGNFVLLDEEGQETDQGEMFLIAPILGMSNRLLNRNHYEVYYKDTPKFRGKTLRRHGDEIERLENGYYRMHGRVDDAMNLGGIKVSSVQIEEIINRLDFIKESAAVAVAPKGGGPAKLVIYYVENSGLFSEEERYQLAKDIIRKKLNPLFKVAELIKTDLLPRTASGKVMRRKLRDQK